jgi:DNA-binding PadR family transcriptional regulator
VLYDILATLWEGPADAQRVDFSVAARTGVVPNANSLERYLQVLEECGYVRGTQRDDSRVYALADRGSELLAHFAQARESGSTSRLMQQWI